VEILKVTFHRFKQFRDQAFELSPGPVTLLAGGNNSGKSSMLHGLAVWEFCRSVIEAEKGPDAFLSDTVQSGQQGMGMGDDEFSPINVPSLKHLWTNLRSQKESEPDGYTLSIACSWIDSGAERSLEFAFSLANDRLFVRVNASDLVAGDIIPRMAYLPPFAGITDREMRLPGAIRRRRLGEGLAGAVLRNLLLDMYENNVAERRRLRGDKSKLADRDLKVLRETNPWELLQDALRRTFQAQLIILPFREEYHSYIRVEVEKGEVNGYKFKRYTGFNKRDLMVEGSGFLQWLSVYTLATNPEIHMLLLDEPDAHLHASLQRELLDRLRTLAEQTGKQVLVATHSSEIIRETAPSEILEISRGGGRYLSSESEKAGLLAGLGTDYAPRLDQVRRTKRVLFTEGKSDVRILRVLAEKMGAEWPEAWIEWNWAAGHKERKQLLLAMREEFGDVVAVSLVDRDDTNLATVGDRLEDKSVAHIDGFHCRRWRRRNIETYLLWPPAIAAVLNTEEEDVRSDLAQAFALAIPDNFTESNVPQPLLDTDGKAVLKYVSAPAHDVAKSMDSSALCDDVRFLVEDLVALVDP